VRYSAIPAVNAVYELVAVLFVVEFQDIKSAERAMTVSWALAELGEDRSWASVWWAYGAVHHDLSDEAFERALTLLAKVDASPEARAAALMLWAEIRFTQTTYSDADVDRDEQVKVLTEAASLVPTWPSLRVRLARALTSVGDVQSARAHAKAAIALTAKEPSGDPFDVAITGRGLRSGWADEELRSLGLAAD
jgi:hypothetical protein